MSVFLYQVYKARLGRGVGASKVHSGAVVLLLLACCLLLLLWLFCVLLCVALCPYYFCNRLGGEGGGWLLCLVCLPGVS